MCELEDAGKLDFLSLKNVYLLKVPKFVANQWKLEKENTIVGVVMKSPQNQVSKDAHDSMSYSLNNTSKKMNPSNEKPRVVLSGESSTYHTALQDQHSNLLGSSSSLKNNCNMIPPAQQIRSLCIETTPANHLYILSQRSTSNVESLNKRTKTMDDDDDEEEDKNNCFQEDMMKESNLHTVPNQDNDELMTQFEPILSPEYQNNKSFVKNSSTLSLIGKIGDIWTFVPEHDSKYHALVKSRTNRALTSSHSTQSTTLMERTGSFLHNKDTASMFRYYRPCNFASNDMFDTLDMKRKVRQPKTSSLYQRQESSSTDNTAREDALKKKLFQAFESTADNKGTLTIQDILTMSGESYNYVKPVLLQIAEPLRTLERKRILYKLKPEFQQVPL